MRERSVVVWDGSQGARNMRKALVGCSLSCDDSIMSLYIRQNLNCIP